MDDLKASDVGYFVSISSDEFAGAMDKWEARHHKCVDLEGDYVEKLKKPA